MPSVAVVAHSGKSFGGGLNELRTVLAQEGVTYPIWYEVTKSRNAPACARRAVADGAEVLFVWGGDGTVQRCINAVAGTGTAVAILPAGTANLLAMNLQIPDDLPVRPEDPVRARRRRPPGLPGTANQSPAGLHHDLRPGPGRGRFGRGGGRRSRMNLAIRQHRLAPLVTVTVAALVFAILLMAVRLQ